MNRRRVRAHRLRASNWRRRSSSHKAFTPGSLGWTPAWRMPCSRARSHPAPGAGACTGVGNGAGAAGGGGAGGCGCASIGMFLLDGQDLSDRSARRPAHAVRHRGVQRNPLVVVPGLEIDVREEIGPERIGSGQDNTHRVADGLDERTEHDRHVVAVAGLQFQHPPGGMEYLDPERVFRITHVALHPPEQRIDLTQIVLGGHAALDQDVDGLLAHVEVARAVADETSDMCRRGPGALDTARDAAAIDARRFRRREEVSTHAHVTARPPSSSRRSARSGRYLAMKRSTSEKSR